MESYHTAKLSNELIHFLKLSWLRMPHIIFLFLCFRQSRWGFFFLLFPENSFKMKWKIWLIYFSYLVEFFFFSVHSICGKQYLVLQKMCLNLGMQAMHFTLLKRPGTLALKLAPWWLCGMSLENRFCWRSDISTAKEMLWMSM